MLRETLQRPSRGAYENDKDSPFSRVFFIQTRDNGSKLKESRFGLDIKKKKFYNESGETLQQVPGRQ